MMKTLTKPINVPSLWTSYIACIKAICDYYQCGASTAGIFGTTGYAFIMNISADLCPSGPTAFSDKPMAALCKNMGISLYGTIFDKHDPGFAKKQKDAWEMTRMAIDNDMPTIGWELGIPEYSIIYGYDEENYLYYDVHGKPQNKKWDALGNSEIGVVSLFSANQEDVVADINKTLKDAFTFALEFSKHKKEWTYPLYSNGIKAYDVWIKALQSDNLNPFGLAYNAAVWSECRNMALEFLKEANKITDVVSLDNLIEQYDVISWALHKVAKLFPIPLVKKDLDSETMDDAIDNLFLAREAEKAALEEIGQLITQF